MRRYVTAGAAGFAAALLVAGITAAPATGAPRPSAAPGIDADPTAVHREDDLPHPLGQAQTALRKEAIAQLLQGKVSTQQRNGSEVIRMSDNRWVEYKKNPAKSDPILTFLVEFGDQIYPAAGGTTGPLHNQIPEPDRNWDGSATDDNTTLWTADFNQAHYQEMLFGESGGESMSDFYLRQSSGQYTVDGHVQDWVQVPYNEARYGSNSVGSANGYWNFVKDTATAWYDAQIAAGKTVDEIRSYLAQFDVWDRYDYDNDGNFNEPDGYIDHFQAIHAGIGEEAGGGAQGSDAIWSHRWYAFSNGVGAWGPDFNRLGGVPLGDTGLYIGDYTTEPENGGLGVFCHEYGHDLGLPDLYDTSGGDNGTGFWTLMSAGSWLGHGGDSIGSTPGYMGAWEKLFLGWLDYKTVDYNGTGDKSTYVVLGAAGDSNGPLPQAVVVNLPSQDIVTEWNTPYSGSYEWWGGSADDLNVTLSRELDLTGATSASVTAKAWYDIESGYDYLYGEVSTNGGSSWTGVGTPIDGDSGDTWVDKSWDVSAFAGQNVLFRFRYQTDGGVHYAGPFLDDISLVKDGATAWTDDVESGPDAWTSVGWTRFGGTETKSAPRFYIAENRAYVEYDTTLLKGPYNFGFTNTRPDFVEHFPYQDGLLVWYVNYAYDNNNTRVHPGYGLTLPVDARPAPITFPGGYLLGNRRQPFDATFGTQPTDEVTFHRLGVPTTVPSQPAIRTFDDSDANRYWSADNPWSSVKVGETGTTIEVVAETHGTTNTMIVKVTN